MNSCKVNQTFMLTQTNNNRHVTILCLNYILRLVANFHILTPFELFNHPMQGKYSYPYLREMKARTLKEVTHPRSINMEGAKRDEKSRCLLMLKLSSFPFLQRSGPKQANLFFASMVCSGGFLEPLESRRG